VRWVLPLYSAAMNEGVVHGLRQALVMLALSAVAVLVGAGLWAAVEDSAFRPKAGIVSMIIAALIGLTGGTALSRATTNDVHAFLGLGPDLEDPDAGESLTGIGVFLFVSLPLFVAGAALYGSG
jgi:hypothetical protein